MNNLEQRVKLLEERVEKLCAEQKTSQTKIDFSGDCKTDLFEFRGRYLSEDGMFGSKFGSNQVRISKLFEIEPSELSNILSAFSSNERILIINNLMKKRMTAKELMQVLNFKTTGKLYHHLSFLEKLGIIKKQDDGYYISPRHISCIVLIFAGVSTLIEKQGN